MSIYRLTSDALGIGEPGRNEHTARLDQECVDSGFPYTPDGKLLAHGHQIHAVVEQAKATGGMVALYPRFHDAQQLAVPGGESINELHMTVTYLGEDVRDQDPTEIISQCDYLAGVYSQIEANVFAYAAFNPAGPEPCMVYLVGGNPNISRLYSDLKTFVTEHYPGSAEQHDPYVPHITAAYGSEVVLQYTGPILFDRIGLRWPGADQDFVL